MSDLHLPEVLRPAATNRRGFFKRAGLGLGAVAAAGSLAACDSGNNPPTPGSFTLNFGTDVGVLNYAYVLEQLEASFYAAVVGGSTFSSTFTNEEQAILRDLGKHEAIHRDFLRAAITGAAGASGLAPMLTFDFSSVNVGNKAQVLGAAQTFEDLGVGAYNGAGRYLRDGGLLTIAGKIVSVEARHASVIAGLLSTNAIAPPGQIDANGLDKALNPRDVLAAARPFIRETITATGL
jgi:hypothetical protein